MAQQEIFGNYNDYDLDILKTLTEERGLQVAADAPKQQYVRDLTSLDNHIDSISAIAGLEDEELQRLIPYYIPTMISVGFQPGVLTRDPFKDPREEVAAQIDMLRAYKNGNLNTDLLTQEGELRYRYAQKRLHRTPTKATPIKEQEVPEVEYKDRVRGMLYGVALGDALGAPHEFKNSIPVSQYTGQLEYQPLVPSRFQGIRYGVVGQVTDDTEMTLALAHSLLQDNGYNRDTVIRAYQDWANSKPFGMGKNTRRLFQGVKTLKGFEQRYQKALKEDLTQTESNGSLMRASPLALLVDPNDLNSFGPVLEDVRLSNPNPVNEEASLIYVMALALALRGADVDTILDTVTEAVAQMSPSIREAVTQVNEGLARNLNAVGKGWVVHGLYAALIGIRYYQAAEEDPFKTALDQVITLGGDTDTNGAIAGALLGALAGYQEMEKEEGANLTILVNADTTKGDFPRPELYLPNTLDELTYELYREFPLEEKEDLEIENNLPSWLWDWAEGEGITGHIVDYQPTGGPNGNPIVVLNEGNQDTWIEVKNAELYNPDLAE